MSTGEQSARHSENGFRIMARETPRELLALLVSGELDGADTALAAEVIGQEFEIGSSLDFLGQTLFHESAIAREGPQWHFQPISTIGVFDGFLNTP